MNAIERVIQKSGNKQAMEEYNDIIAIMNAAKDYIDVVDNSISEVSSLHQDKEIYYQILRNHVKYWWGDLL